MRSALRREREREQRRNFESVLCGVEGGGNKLKRRFLSIPIASLPFLSIFCHTTRCSSSISAPMPKFSEQVRRRRQLLLRLLLPSPSGPIPYLKNFTNKEIKRATSGFSTIIRSGPHGVVFKAHFSDGYIGAVMQLRTPEQSSTFSRDVQLLACLHHRHLVNLRGFSEGRNRFLVYDYMENGSLKDCLHDPLRTPLGWRTRLQVATSMAAAMEYLHFFCNPPLSDVPIDSSNILLDENFVPKLCNFGLLRHDDKNVVEKDAILPEGLMKSSNVIFQFGVLILELVTGQSFESEGMELIQWVQNSGSTYSMHNMVDTDLGNDYDAKELKCLLGVARWCTKTGDKSVLSIRHIHRYLQKKLESHPSGS